MSTPQGFSADPIPTDILRVRDGISCWFGGIYDPATRSYNNPQVEGLGVVRRSRGKVQSDEEFFIGATEPGPMVGSTMKVHLDTWTESRVAIAGASDGLKLVQGAVVLHVFLLSHAEFAEDAEDGFYDLLMRLSDRIRQDRCMGTGGFEAGGFQVGEGGTPWVTWQMEPPEVSHEVTSAYASCTFNVHFYLRG